MWETRVPEIQTTLSSWNVMESRH